MKKIIIFILLLTGFIFIAGCINKNLSPSLSENLSLKLEIHDSIQKSLTIQNNGILIFTEGENANSTRLSPDEINSLKQYILDNDFFSMKEEYEGSGCCGFVAHTITVSIGDSNHRVYCYNNCPEEFNNIKNKIKSLWTNEIRKVGWS